MTLIRIRIMLVDIISSLSSTAAIKGLICARSDKPVASSEARIRAQLSKGCRHARTRYRLIDNVAVSNQVRSKPSAHQVRITPSVITNARVATVASDELVLVPSGLWDKDKA